MNNKYFNEEKYQKIKRTLIIFGCISIFIALLLLVLAIIMHVPDMSSDEWFTSSTARMFMFIGAFFFGIMVPFILFPIAFARDINTFTAQSTIPVAKEGIEEMIPTINKTAKEITKGVKEGLEDKE